MPPACTFMLHKYVTELAEPLVDLSSISVIFKFSTCSLKFGSIDNTIPVFFYSFGRSIPNDPFAVIEFTYQKTPQQSTSIDRNKG